MIYVKFNQGNTTVYCSKQQAIVKYNLSNYDLARRERKHNGCIIEHYAPKQKQAA